MHDESYATAFAIKTSLEKQVHATDEAAELEACLVGLYRRKLRRRYCLYLGTPVCGGGIRSIQSDQAMRQSCFEQPSTRIPSRRNSGMGAVQPGLRSGCAPAPRLAHVMIPMGLATASSRCMAEILDAPLNYFMHSYGPASRPTMYLGWVLAGISATVLFIIALLLIMAVFRKRQAADPRAIGPEGKGLRWIYIGTGISTCVLAGLVVYSMMVLNAVAKPPEAPAITLTVTGYDWWWKVEYEHSDPARRFVTANEVHIPAGQPVLVKLKSADVIHAFWVPVLAGKTQMIPGSTNQQWIQADVPGTYAGQCTQYCGAGHARMGFEVIAEDARDFEKWLDAQRLPASLASVSTDDPGYKLFMDQCAGCHAIQGTEAAGAHAPDLTHLNSRRRLAAGLLTNTPEHLMNWITRAQQLKPGSRMPSIHLSEAESSALAEFLSKLD